MLEALYVSLYNKLHLDYTKTYFTRQKQEKNFAPAL